MGRFSVGLFLKNLKYLGRYNFKRHCEKIGESYITGKQLNESLDNLIYELPSLIEHSRRIFRPKIKDFDETLNELIRTNKSIVRFGDGEIAIMENGDAAFQRYDVVLSQRLKQVLQSQKEDLMVCINYHYYYADLSDFLEFPKLFYRTHVDYFRTKLNQYLIPKKQYYAAGITQIYQMFQGYDCVSYYKKMRSVWRGKDLTIICGDETFANIQYNIFDCAKSIGYIYGPFKNAMDKYDELLEKAKKISMDSLIILILGPTAKILAYDLHNLGYRVLDLGHIAKDYDLVMKNAQRTAASLINFFQD